MGTSYFWLAVNIVKLLKIALFLLHYYGCSVSIHNWFIKRKETVTSYDVKERQATVMHQTICSLEILLLLHYWAEHWLYTDLSYCKQSIGFASPAFVAAIWYWKLYVINLAEPCWQLRERSTTLTFSWSDS